MRGSSRFLVPTLACLLAVEVLHGAGFPIRRADSTWGEFSAGLLDGNAFVAAGNAHGTAAGSEISFIGKWDMDGNPIWEKSTRAWADAYRSIRRNADGTYLLLGNTCPLPRTPGSWTGTLFLTLDGEGNTLSRTYVNVLSPWTPDSAAGDTLYRINSDFLDFATVQGRNFILGKEDRSGWPFLAEVDSGYRLIRAAYFSQEERDFVASKLLPWNGKLLVLGSAGDLGDGATFPDVTPTVLVVGLDGNIERTLDTLEFSRPYGFLTDGMVVGDRVLVSGPRILAQLGPDLQIEWKTRIQPADSDPTLLRRDAHGNLLMFYRTRGVNLIRGQSIHTFDPRGNLLQTSSLVRDFAGFDFLPTPGGRLLALGLGIDSLPRRVDEAARIYSIDLAAYLRPPTGVARRPESVRPAGRPAGASRDASGRRAGGPASAGHRLLWSGK